MSDETLQYPAKITEERIVRAKNAKGQFLPRGSVDESGTPLVPRAKVVIPAIASEVEFVKYLQPPKPMLPANDCYDIPDASGIYFVWSNERIVYVGQSNKLSRRCSAKNHQNIKKSDWLSWLEFPRTELYYAESYYIGALRPERNRSFNFYPVKEET